MEEIKPGKKLIEDEKKDFLSRYVKPHDKKSREVKEEDLERVIEEAHVLYNLCFTKTGRYMGGHAVVHMQIDDKDPLQLFVIGHTMEVIINPILINHTQVPIKSIEGCLSFPDLPMINVPRWNKITVKFNRLGRDGKISEPTEENMGGKRSLIFQHEMQHLGLFGNKLYIY